MLLNCLFKGSRSQRFLFKGSDHSCATLSWLSWLPHLHLLSSWPRKVLLLTPNTKSFQKQAPQEQRDCLGRHKLLAKEGLLSLKVGWLIKIWIVRCSNSSPLFVRGRTLAHCAVSQMYIALNFLLLSSKPHFPLPWLCCKGFGQAKGRV